MWMLLNVIIALAPTAIWAAVVTPLAALRIFPLAIATCLLCEFLFVIITKKDPKAFKIENILSSIITGMIYGLCLPTEMSWDNGMGYVIVIFGAAIGIILGKLVFGGLGNNIFNPAALGMVVVRLFWGGFLSSSTASTGGFIDGSIVAGGTSLSYGATYSNIANADFLGMFFSQTDEAPASSAPSPLVKAGAPSALASITEKENLLLSDSEKRLIYYYRNSIRKYSIMERAKEIYEDDISIAQDSEL